MIKETLIFFCFLNLHSYSQVTATIRPEVNKLVQQLIDSAKTDNDNYVVEDKIVGNIITKDGTAQYQRFLKLKKLATQKELIELTNHENPMIRCYSFWAISKNRISNQLLENHINDSTKIIFYTDGDVRYPYSVFDFMKSSKNRW